MVEGLLCSLGLAHGIFIPSAADMWLQEASPSERGCLVRGSGLLKTKQKPKKPTANLAKEKLGVSCISAEVRHIGVRIDLYSDS